MVMNYHLRNRGGVSHEFGEMPRLLGGDSRIQTISFTEKVLGLIGVFGAMVSYCSWKKETEEIRVIRPFVGFVL
jgi:hypothetical protein